MFGNLRLGLGLASARSGAGMGDSVGTPDEDVEALFSSGGEGAWYDPSDLSTLWADTAGTIPASVGGEVARVDDKSGNGHHVTQSVIAARPILRQSGGLYYLEFDGIDDVLFSASPFLWGMIQAGRGNITVAASIVADPLSDNCVVMEGSHTTNNPSLFAIAKNTSNRFTSLLRDDAAASRVTLSTASLTIADGTPKVIGFNDSYGSIVRRVNGVSETAITYTTPATLTLTRFAVGAFIRTTTDWWMDGNFYGAVIHANADVSAAETWAAEKSGVTL